MAYKNMKVLLISYYFAPQNAIAAVRTTKIAKYLIKNGYDVDVLCGQSNTYDPILLNDSKLVKNIEVVKNYDIYNKYFRQQNLISSNLSSAKKNRASNIYRILKTCSYLLPNPAPIYLELLNSVAWYYRARNRSKLLGNHYDVILSSYGPIGSHMLGLYAKKRNKKSLWISDYRDPLINDSNRGLVKIINRVYQNLFLKKSDISICVSQGLRTSLRKINKKAIINVIRNGFDQEDLQYIQKKNNTIYFNNNKLIFTYCGALYSGKRDFSSLFHTLFNLITAEKVSRSNIEIHYAGLDFHLLWIMAEKYGLEDLIINHGFMLRDEALQLTSRGDIALLASWNTEKSQGVITGKVYELFMLKKMILCFISGSIPNSELKSMIERANAGYVYEEGSSSIKDLEEKIIFIYNKKMNGELITQQYNEEYLKQYSYDTIIENLKNIIIHTRF